MNDWVREELLDVLTASEVAEVVSDLDTDDAVSIIEELDEDDPPRGHARARPPTTAPRSRRR